MKPKWMLPFDIPNGKLSYSNSSITFDENITLNTNKKLTIGSSDGTAGQVLFQRFRKWNEDAGGGVNNVANDGSNNVIWFNFSTYTKDSEWCS